MANRIELFVDVDPTGRGAAAIRSIRAEIGSVAKGTKEVADQGGLLGSVFAGDVLANFFNRAASAAVSFGKESVQAYGELVQDQRFLNSQIEQTGVNFDEANKKVEEFDRRLTLSRSNAEKLYATTLQFTNEIGRVGKTDEFITKLSDILISHGVSPEGQADITRSLLAGRATELGKVLGQNVATIEKQAAAAGGFADFAKLDDATKKLLLFNEVLQEGEKYAGAANDRLKDADGTLGQLAAAYDRAKESAGKFLMEESLVGDAIRAALGISPEEYEAHKFDVAQRRAEAEARRHADELAAAADNSHRQYELAKGKADEFQDFNYLIASRGKEQAEALRTTFINQYAALFKDKSVDVITLSFAERQFQHIKGILDPAKREEIAKGIRELFLRFEKEAATYLKGIRNAAEGLFTTLADRYAGDRDNPFVKIFTDADESARKLEKTFGILGAKVVGELKGIEGAYYRQLALAAELDSRLSASDLRRKAEDIQGLRPGEFSAQEDRAISLIERRLDAVKSTAELAAKAQAIAAGLDKTGLQGALDKRSEAILGVQFRQLQGMLGGIRGTGAGDQEQRARIYEAIAGIFEQLKPETQAAISRGEIPGRETFINAYQGLQEASESRIKREIEQGKFLDEQLGRAREDIEAIGRAQREGLASPEADKRLLRRIESLPENALTPDIRRAGFDAYMREAERQDGLQSAAIEATTKARESTDKLTTAIDNLAKASQDPRQRELLIRILNKSRADVQDNLYGSLQPVPPTADSQ